MFFYHFLGHRYALCNQRTFIVVSLYYTNWSVHFLHKCSRCIVYNNSLPILYKAKWLAFLGFAFGLIAQPVFYVISMNCTGNLIAFFVILPAYNFSAQKCSIALSFAPEANKEHIILNLFLSRSQCKILIAA